MNKKIDSNTLEVTETTTKYVTKDSLLSYREDLLFRKVDVENKLNDVNSKIALLEKE